MKRVHYEIYRFFRKVLLNWRTATAEARSKGEEPKKVLHLRPLMADDDAKDLSWGEFVDLSLDQQYEILFPDMKEDTWKELQEKPTSSPCMYSL